jgi:hypothetical protein
MRAGNLLPTRFLLRPRRPEDGRQNQTGSTCRSERTMPSPSWDVILLTPFALCARIQAMKTYTCVLASTVALIAGSTTLIAQGPLSPAGPPDPTLKTLQQVEPRVDVSTLPGDAAALHIISRSGSYYLSKNLTLGKTNDAIRIVAPNVTLDLNGFSIAGPFFPKSTGTGVDTGATSLQAVRIRNGAIKGIGMGIDLSNVSQASIDNIRVTGCTEAAFKLGHGCSVANCVAAENGAGFSASLKNRCIFLNCSALANTSSGINTGGDGSIVNCVAIDNGQDGIHTRGGCSIVECVANANANAGITVLHGNTIRGCTVDANTGHGIRAYDGCTIVACTARANKGQAGIRCGDACTLENCTAYNNTSSEETSAGIWLDSIGTVSRCTSVGTLTTHPGSTATAGVGIQTGSASQVLDCVVRANRGHGIFVGNGSVVRGCSCGGNGLPKGGAGVYMDRPDSRAEGNHVTENAVGIQARLDGSVIIRNCASGNTTNYVIAAGNVVGPIVQGTTSSAISGSTGGSGVGTTDPWANLSF